MKAQEALDALQDHANLHHADDQFVRSVGEGKLHEAIDRLEEVSNQRVFLAAASGDPDALRQMRARHALEAVNSYKKKEVGQ